MAVLGCESVLCDFRAEYPLAVLLFLLILILLRRWQGTLCQDSRFTMGGILLPWKLVACKLLGSAYHLSVWPRERVWDIAAEDPPGLLEVSGSKGSHLPQQERVGMDKTDVLGEDS